VLPAAKKGSSGLNLLLEATQKGNPNPRSGAVTLASIASMVHNNTSDLAPTRIAHRKFSNFASEMRTI
jgi:hypothetical protein